MSHTALLDARVWQLLLTIDREFAAEARAAGCACGGPLHSARYARKPRGGLPAEFRAEYSRRESLCCAREGCRKRTTPASVRFLGPKVYLGAVVTLVTALRHGANARRAGELGRAIGASRRTLARWRRWWQEIFTATAFWQAARALWVPAVSVAELPASLLERFAEGEDWMRLFRLLDFMAPVTTRSGRSISMLG